MKNKQLIAFTIGIVIFFMPLMAVFNQQELSVQDIVKKADDNIRGKTSLADITIKIIRPTWSREMNLKAWAKGRIIL